MKSEKFRSNISVLIALVTVLGAIAACLASVATSDAGDMDFTGLDTSIRAQKAEIINEVNAYEHYRAYTSYIRYIEMGYLLYDPNADEETDLRNGALQREVWGLASGIRSVFFSPRYIQPNGDYDVEQELDEAWAEDSQNEELDAQPYFDKSDRLRRRSSFLTADMIVLAVSFWFLTVAQATEKKIKYLWAALGIFAGLAGILGILIGRFMI
jgi:hypothetical protein